MRSGAAIRGESWWRPLPSALATLAPRVSEIYDVAMEDMELVQVLHRIPKAHRTALRVRAAEQGTNATELVRRIIRDYLADSGARQGE